MSFAFDFWCFFGTIGRVFGQKGVVKDGTGELEKRAKELSTK